MRLRAVAACLIFAGTLAADVTGKWRGTITTDMAANTSGGEIPAYLELQQSGGKVTGSAGGNEAMLYKIDNGRVEGDRLVIEASPRQGTVLRFTLAVKGDVLEGQVEENDRAIGTARLKREK